MKGLAEITKGILGSEEVTVCRVKDRFNKTSSAGWTDCMVNFYFNDDPLKHVCEVQLIHFKMLSQRTTQEGHGAYNIFRAAWELLKKTVLFRKRAGENIRQHMCMDHGQRRDQLQRQAKPALCPWYPSTERPNKY